MTLTEKQHAKLLKLLALTSSPHDGEALSAIRMANNLMTRAETSWSDLLDETEKLRQQLRTAKRPVHKPTTGRPRAGVDDSTIRGAFKYLSEQMRGFYFSLALRLQEHYIDNGYLTIRQWQVLNEMVIATRENERLRRKRQARKRAV